MTFNQKVTVLKTSPRCEMESSKIYCIETACELFENNKLDQADTWLETAASYAFGGPGSRPSGWTQTSEAE